ncbi:hypothetical protein AZG88_41070 [Rhodococcus sp. LB1]|nr:hypothetical protein AZG88_41070 [Rhodococcus sp. LB1]
MDKIDSENLLVVGAGLGGLATAIAAAERGFRVTILEAADRVGGAAAYSAGVVWSPANHVMLREGVHDSMENAATFIKATAGRYPELLDDSAMYRFLTMSPRAVEYFENLGVVQWKIIPAMPDSHAGAPGWSEYGRYLSAVFDADLLGDWRDKLRYTPHFPYETNYWEIHEKTGKTPAALTPSSDGGKVEPPTRELSETDRPINLLGFGTGVVANFLHATSRRNEITIRLEHRVEALIIEDERVAGVVVDTSAGRETFRGKVVLATSGFDSDPALVKRFTGLGEQDYGTMAPRTNRGDGFRLAASAGADLVQFPARSAPYIPGYFSGKANAFLGREEYTYPHTFIVNCRGERFCDDSYYGDLAWQALAPDAQHFPIYMIWDEEHHRRYGGVGADPGGDYEEGLVESATTMKELGTKLGIDGVQLERTAAEFNGPAATAADPRFGRGSDPYVQRFYGDPTHELHPNIAPVATPPYFGMRLRLNMVSISMSGVRTDPDGHVLDISGKPIPHLYAVGAVAAFTATGTSYQGGFSLSRALTMALTVAECASRE